MIEFIIFDLVILALVASYFLGGIFARMDGGGGPKTPEIVERLLCMSFFALAVAPVAGWWSLAALGGMVGLAVGHGPYWINRLLKGLGGDMPGVDFIVRIFFGRDWREQYMEDYRFSDAEAVYYYEHVYPKLLGRNLFGLFLTGILVGLPAAIIAGIFGTWWAALALLLPGPIKALAYYVHRENTENAEILNGRLRSVVATLTGLALYFYA